jgi:hypothetical protein
MTNIIERNGFFNRIIPPVEEGDEIREVPLVDFIHGYAHRNGQKIPVTTVCIVPFVDGGKLWFGIGMSHCSVLDQPVKARGRQISEARARGVIKADGDLHWKPDFSTNFSEGSICGIRSHFEDANDGVEDMGLETDMHNRVIKSLDFLRKVCGAEQN